MSQGTQVRFVENLEQSFDILEDLSEEIKNRRVRPFIISRLRRRELLKKLAEAKHGLFGFDHTLHHGSQWQAIRELLDPNAAYLWNDNQEQRPVNGRSVALSNKLAGRALCMSQDSQNQTEQAILQSAWTMRIIERLKQCGTDKEQIRGLADRLKARAGAVEIFRFMNKTAIVSWGLSDIIQAWLENNGIAMSFRNQGFRTLAVGATRLEYDDQDLIIGCDHPSIVVNANKGTVAQRFLESFGISEGITLALGDSAFDLDLMPFIPVDKTHSISGVNLLIMSPEQAEDKINELLENPLERLWRRVTGIIIAEDLMPLVNLLLEARGLDPQQNLENTLG